MATGCTTVLLGRNRYSLKVVGCTWCSAYAPLHALSFPQMLTFGVLAALMMSWDGAYTSAADQLRLLPGQAAECLRKWATLCQKWAVRPLLLAWVGLEQLGVQGAYHTAW